MINRKNIIIIALAVTAAGLLISTFYLLNRITRLEESMPTAERQSGRDRNGRITDPYIQGQVKNTILRNREAVLACYSELLKRPGVTKKEGKVKMDWHVAENGEVVSPGIVFAEIGDDEFKACLTAAVSKWRFPEPPGGRKKYIEHTFNFSDKK